MVPFGTVLASDEDGAIRQAIRISLINEEDKIQVIQEELLTVDEVALELRISGSHVRRLQSQGVIPYTSLGNRRLTAAEEIEGIKRGRAISMPPRIRQRERVGA